MADDQQDDINDRRQQLKAEGRRFKRQEGKARRQEMRRKMELAAIKRAQKETGRAAKIAGGELTGRGAQATTFAAGLPVKAAGMVGSPFTFGTTGVASTAATTAAEQVAYQASKRGARPIFKQIGKAPYRPLIAAQKMRAKGAQRRKQEAQAARKETEAALADLDDSGLEKRLLGALLRVYKAIIGQAIAIPLEVVLGIVASLLLLVAMVGLVLYLVLNGG